MDGFLLIVKLIVVGLAIAQIHEYTVAQKERDRSRRQKVAALEAYFKKLDKLENEANTNTVYEHDAIDQLEEDQLRISEMVHELKNAMAYLAGATDFDRGNLGLKTNEDYLREAAY